MGSRRRVRSERAASIHAVAANQGSDDLGPPAKLYCRRFPLARIDRMNGSKRYQDGDRGPQGPSRFQTTRWSMVLHARDGDATYARKVLEALSAKERGSATESS
jgi:hypothetical protein